jgi:hypothetical protein
MTGARPILRESWRTSSRRTTLSERNPANPLSPRVGTARITGIKIHIAAGATLIPIFAATNLAIVPTTATTRCLAPADGENEAPVHGAMSKERLAEAAEDRRVRSDPQSHAGGFAIFVGHYAASLALKGADQRVPLTPLFLGVQMLDVVSAALVLLGIEHWRVVPGITAASPLDLDVPYTHGLLTSLGWAVLCYLVVRFVPSPIGAVARARAALFVAIAVWSHWWLDLIVHRPDLPLYDHTLNVGARPVVQQAGHVHRGDRDPRSRAVLVHAHKLTARARGTHRDADLRGGLWCY